MKASVVTTLFVGFAAISFCAGFTSRIPHANPAALSHRALHSTQLFVSVQEETSSLAIDCPRENDKKVLLLKQAENYLGSAMMIYFYAKLRQFSYCGYTKTKFKEVDCNQDDESISGYKLLDIFLKERRWVIQRMDNPEEWRSDRSLRDTLQELLDVKPPKNPSWAKDLASLQDQIRQIGIGAAKEEEEEAAEKLLGSIGKGSANRTPDDSESSDVLEQGVRGALKTILNPPTKVALETDSKDENVVDLIREFCDGFLKQDSEIIQVFKEPFELVYFGDRYPGKECVYSIRLIPGKKRVVITFRGSVNLNDWANNARVLQKEVDNPAWVEGDESGQPHKIGIHNGFHSFLLRKRVDKTGATKFNRIISRVEKYMEDGWTLGVTGHSLGAALATLFSFYAATDQRILQNGKPVEVFSFASPFVGDDKFRTAFKLLEREGKLVHARIVNDHDFVTMFPFVSPKIDLEKKLSAEAWDVKWYKHVGLQIFLKQAKENKEAAVEYPFKEGVFAEAARTLQSNFVSSAPLILDSLTSHSTPEYQERIETAVLQDSGTSDLDYTLVEYYERNVVAKVSDK
jgi:hypothetical protein